MTRVSSLAIAAIAFGLSLPAFAASPSDAPKLEPGAWPQAHSDLKPDPSIRFGSLPNGMRYAIMQSATPLGQVSMRLRFDVGSLMERDDQQGLAHFLEHMAFNGSTNVPTRGEMVKKLQRLGLAFGADTNAQTGFDATTYKFDLPRSDDETVDTSLMLLREIAGNLKLDQAAMDQERGVILSEERLRDTPDYEITKARFGFTLKGQRPPERFPIGLVDVIKTAQSGKLLDIYRHYYRPERATLVVVGDFDPAAMEARIKARFSDWKGQGPAGDDPSLGEVQARGPDFQFAVRDGAPTTVELAWVGPPDLSQDSLAKRRRDVIDQLGLAVLNRRLGTLARTDAPPFISAGAFRGEELRAEEVAGLLAYAQPGHWKEALTATDGEVRRLLQYGVRADELAREVTETESSLELAVAGAGTRRTAALADEIAGTLDDADVETSPSEDLAIFDQVARRLTPADIDTRLRADFAGPGPLVFLSSPTPVDGGLASVKDAYDGAVQLAVAAPEAPKEIAWPYTSFGRIGTVASRTEVPDLDSVLVRFDNGVRLTVKPTKFANDEVLVKVRFGHGLESLPADRQTATWAGDAFAEGGLRQISADDAERALAGQVYGVNFGAEPDAFALAGATRAADAPTQLEVLAAYVADPGWRPEAFQRIKTYGASLEDQFAATDTGVLSRDLSGLLHAGDGRWTFPTRDEIGRSSVDELKSAIGPALASGPVEVVMVGDITVDKAIQDVAETFGALPARPDPSPPARPDVDTRFPPPSPTPVVETHAGRSDQGVALEAWPTQGFFADPQEARTREILARVLELRLTDVLRMREGVTYSPQAGSVASQVFPAYGYISAEMEAPPPRLDGFFDDVAKITADLKATPVGADELERAKKPAVDDLEKSMHSNEYWLNGLSGAQEDPRRLAALRTFEAQLERVSAADVQKAAQTWLKDDSVWKLEIRPKGTAVASAAP